MRKFILKFALIFAMFNAAASDFWVANKSPSFGQKFSDLLSFRGVDFYSSIASSLCPRDMEKSKIKLDEGFALRTSAFTGIFSLGIPSVKLLGIGEAFQNLPDFSSAMNFFNMRYGFSADLSSLRLPVEIRFFAGGLSFAGGVSRLKNPVPSLTSALKSPLQPVCGLRTSLPGNLSSEKPFSISMNLSPKSGVSFFPEIQMFATSDNDFFASIHKNFEIPFLLAPAVSTVSVNVGSFVYGKECSASWTQLDRPFLFDRYLSGSLEMFISSRRYKVFLCGAVNQSPFGGFYKWLRSGFSIIFPRFVTNASFYLGDKDLISAGGGDVKTWLQIQLNPWSIFPFGSMNFKTGLLFQWSIKNDENICRKDYGELVFRWNGSLRGALRTLSADFTVRYLPELEDLKINAGMSASFRFRKLNLTSNLSYKNEDGKSVVTFSCNLAPRGGVMDSLSQSVAVSVGKNSKISSSAKSSVSFKKKWRNISVSANVSVGLSF